MRRATILAIAVIVLLLAAMAGKCLLVSVPAVRATHSPSQFDAARAKTRLARILGDEHPHPADSVANDIVRGRIVAELRAIGVDPIVRDQSVCNDFRKARLVACTRARNVLAVFGPRSGKALLLAAHYDSVPVGPGASDDGIGVATLLEIGSILTQHPLGRPVILLFDEGEELGLVGARAFLADPLSRNVDSLLNFEARGVTGRATMFETSVPNGGAISTYSASVSRPLASSLSTDVARLIPNDTDVTAFKERGWLALNFAITGNETHYHSSGDNLAALDLRSLQDMGDQGLAVASRLAAGTPQADGDRIFVDLLGRAFIQLPLLVGAVLLGLLLVLLGLLVRKRGAIIRGPAQLFAAMVAGGALGWIAIEVIGVLRAGTYWGAHPELAFTAVYATVTLGTLAVLQVTAKRLTTGQARAAYWFLFVLSGAVLALFAPGAIIYFLMPPAAVLIGVALARRYQPAETIGGIVALLLLYLTWGEMLSALEVLFSPGPLAAVLPAAAIMILAVLVEARPLLLAANRRVLLGASALLAVAGWAVAATAPAYSQERQQRFTIEHVTLFPPGKALWSVLNDGASLPKSYEAVGNWRRAKLPFSERRRWLAPAPQVLGIAGPAIQPLEITRSGNERLIRLRLAAKGWERLTIIVPKNAHVTRAGVPGFMRPLGDSDSPGRSFITCTGRSCDGMQLMLDQAPGTSMILTLAAARNGLPAAAAPLVHARPALARPQYVPDETVAITRVKI